MLPYPVYIWDGALGQWVDHGNLRGVGIQKIEQISSSMDSLGANVIRVTLDDDSFYDYTVRNGDRGPAGSLWIGTSEPPDDSYSIWLNPSGMVSGYVGTNQGAENAGRVLAVGEDGVVVPREETPYTLPEASSDALGGVKADSAESYDTQPVRKGTDGKLYTAPGSGGASEWTLFQEGITDADVSGFEFDGVGDYTEFLFLGSWVKGSGSAGLSVKMNDAYALTVGNYFVHNGHAKNVSVELILMERKRFSLRGLSQQQNSTQYNIDELGTQSIYNIPQGIETPITKISFYSSTTSVQIPAGATYALYVR